MALTRFKDDRAGYDGPVSGSLQVITVNFPTLSSTTSDRQDIKLPAGMRFRVTDASVHAEAVTATPQIQIGTVANATALVALTSVATLLGALTVKSASQHIVRGGVIRVGIEGGAGDAATNVTVTIVGHVSAPPDSVLIRTGNRSHF